MLGWQSWRVSMGVETKPNSSSDPSILLAVMMQLNTFKDESMKILYALSFMCRGIVQVWAQNETNMVLSHMSTFSTLAELLADVKRTSGDPNWERTAHALLHALNMMRE